MSRVKGTLNFLYKLLRRNAALCLTYLSRGALLDYTLILLWTVANLYKLLTKLYAKKVVFMKQPWNGKFKLLHYI